MAKKHVTTTELIKTTQTTITETTIEEHALPTLPTLEIIEGKVFCTSLQIAEHFEKNHFDVLRDTEEQIAKIKAGRHAGSEENMFLKGFYETQAGFGKVKKPMYYLNRDGFMKLVMGYNGAKASDIQMDYIEAFNKMEAMLLNLKGIPEKPVKYLSSAQTQALKQRVDRLVTPIWIQQSYINTIWNRLRFVANADTQNTIPADQYDALMEELDRMEHTMTGDHGGYKLLEEFHDFLYRQVLCLGTPFSMTVRKNWFAKFGSLLPKNISWRKAALMLEEAA